MMFHVGQMVVCVDDNFVGTPHEGPFPVRGMVYTIRGFDPEGVEPGGVWLEEIVRQAEPPWKYEYGFRPDRFRPVKRTNIEIFRKLVAPSPDKVTA